MRQERGLKELIQHNRGQISAKTLSQLLLNDLKECCCSIYGKSSDEVPILLAKLNIVSSSLSYEMFDQRIELVVTGKIINNDYVPLTYRVQGQHYYFHGRCSVIPKVCGVDLYLSKTYTGTVGDTVRQRFFVSVKQLLKMLK